MAWHMENITEPTITIKELSRLLINYRKKVLKDLRFGEPGKQLRLLVIKEIRSMLNLRGRARR